MQLDKPYYSITETAKMFNVNASLLRYWEKEFSQIKPYKNKKGDRYSVKVMKVLDTADLTGCCIKQLRRKGFGNRVVTFLFIATYQVVSIFLNHTV